MEARAFHPEDRSRTAIDAKLLACGWIVQNRDEINLSAGAGVAVREFTTTAGPADYGLFVDQTFCGVVEAKPDGTTLSGFSEQAAGYLSGAPDYFQAGLHSGASNTSRPAPKQYFAISPIPNRALAGSSSFIGPRPCACG
jgi:type I site-specific restriction endonuclease